eukprot:1157922-Pelagomonas_calceolata.AAC.7
MLQATIPGNSLSQQLPSLEALLGKQMSKKMRHIPCWMLVALHAQMGCEDLTAAQESLQHAFAAP